MGVPCSTHSRAPGRPISNPYSSSRPEANRSIHNGITLLVNSSNKLFSPGDVILDKANEFGKEMQGLQAAIFDADLTTKELIEDIVKHELKYNGVDLKKARENDEARALEVKKLHDVLRKIRRSMSSTEVATAKSMGLLDSNGDVYSYDVLSANENTTLASMSPNAVPFTMWGLTISEAARFQGSTSNQVKRSVCGLIRKFQVMKTQDAKMMVALFMKAGIWGLGLHGVSAVWNILGMVPDVTDNTKAFAILEGVKAVGENVINFAIRATMQAILVPLFTQNNGDTSSIMVILNNSNEDMKLADIYLERQNGVGTFNENLNSDDHQPIIPKRMPAIVNVKTRRTIVKGSIYACFYVGRKRDKTPTDLQGVLKFEPTERFPMGALIWWEVPLAHRNSRIFVSAEYDATALDFSKLVKSQDSNSQLSSSKSSTEGKITGLVDNSKETPAYFIVNIESPSERLVKAPKIPSLEEKATKLLADAVDVTIPDAVSGKSIRQLIDDIFTHEKEQHGIDWPAAAQEGDRAVNNAIYKAHNRLYKIATQMNANEVKRATEMDLLDSNGNVKMLDLLGNEATANPNLASIPIGAIALPCLGLTLEQAAILGNADGDDIKNIILKIIRIFQLAEKCDERHLAHFFIDIGVWGIGTAAVSAIWELLKALDKPTAIAFAIAEFGINIMHYILSTITLAIIIPVLLYETNDAAGVLLFINDSNEDMRLEALNATQGKLTGIFKERNNKSQRLPLIPRRQKPAYMENDVSLNDGAVFAGFVVVRKKDNASVGTKGAVKFAATNGYPMGVFVEWKIPISQAMNKVLVSTDFAGSLEAWGGKTNDQGEQENTSQFSNQARVTCRISNNNGSPAFSVINISHHDNRAVKQSLQAETIEEKAEQFWNDIRDLELPHLVDGKTSEQVISDIIKHEKLHHGIDWEAAAKGAEKEVDVAVKKAHNKLHEIRKKMNNKEVERAQSMGLLDREGKVPLYHVLGDGKSDPMETHSDPVPFTIWGWKVETAAKYQTATGRRIKDLVVNLIRMFQVTGADDERMMTKTFMEAGLWGLGTCSLIKVMQTLRASNCATKAIEAFAVASGIIEVGINVIKLGIHIMIVTMLVPLLVSPSKDACAVCVIVNDSDDDLDLVEYHAKLGKVIGIFKENTETDNPKPVIPRRINSIISTETGKEICTGSVQAGLFAAQANTSSLVETQGALKFGVTSSFSNGIFMGWEVPMDGSTNRVLVSADFRGSTSQFSNKTNEENKQEDMSDGSSGAKVVGRVHSGHGSHGYYVFSVSEPRREVSKEHTDQPLLLAKKEPTEKTHEELLDEIFDHEKKVNGIDWKAAAKGGKEAIHEATKKARDRIQSMADNMTKEELSHAMELGLVDKNGKVPDFNVLDEHEPPVTLGAAMGATPTVPIPSTAAPYMVWGWNSSKAKEYEDSRGGDIKTKVLKLVRAFQAIKKDNTEKMAHAFMKMGIWGVGLVGLRAAWSALTAAASISEAVEIAAIVDGIAAIGASVVTLAIAACILAVIVPIFIFMSKNAAGIMVIINDSDEDMRMIDLHATHGKVVGIFKEKAELDNPQPILPKRLPPIINPKTKKVIIEGSVQAGFFAARKRDSALVGTQGGMRFEATQRYPQGVYIGWEVPLSFTSNRLLVSATFTGSASEFSNKTNDHGKQEDSSTSTKGGVVFGCVNSGSGSEAYYIFSIK